MMNQDWEKIGEDITNAVQDAIDSQNFHKLNQTITDTINHAADTLVQSLKHITTEQGRDYSVGQTYEYTGGTQAVPRKDTSVLYYKTIGAKVGGTALVAAGFLFGGIFTVIFLIFLLISLLVSPFGGFQILRIMVFLVLIMIGYGAGGIGICMRRRVKRFREYLQIIGQREYCNVRELADKTHKNIKFIVKDLEKMISNGWFRQGHLDKKKTCLMVSHKAYEQYLQLEKERQQQELDEKKQEVQKKPLSNPFLSPEVRKVIEEGENYLGRIHKCNDAISGIEISEKISRIEVVVDQIFDRVEKNPESVDAIRRLMEYYLPATVKLLEAYQELDEQPIDGENIRASKAEIEATLDTLNLAFEKLLDNLFQDTAWDVSSDISVLQTMLAQEGLTQDRVKNRTD